MTNRSCGNRKMNRERYVDELGAGSTSVAPCVALEYHSTIVVLDTFDERIVVIVANIFWIKQKEKITTSNIKLEWQEVRCFSLVELR